MTFLGSTAVRWTVLSKLILLLGYASSSAICLGSALVSVGLLYNEAVVIKVLVYLLFTVAGTAAGFYLYFCALRVFSPKRRVFSYPVAHHQKL